MDKVNEVVVFLTQHWMVSTGLFALVVALLMNEIRRFSALNTYSPQQVVDKMNHEQAKVIDCREPEAFKTGHILGAVNIPKLKLEESQSILSKFKSKQIILVCHQGTDSPKIGTKLRKLGFEHVSVLEGGIQSWKKEGMPLERG